MNKWYRSNVTKAILIILAHVASVAIILMGILAMGHPEMINQAVSGKKTGKYDETAQFAQQVWADGVDILELLESQLRFGKDDADQKEEKIDLQQAYITGEFSKENNSGLFYTREEVSEWINLYRKKIAVGEDSIDEKAQVIVCQKQDDTYDYFYYNEFKEMVDKKELQFNPFDKETKYNSTEDIMNLLIRSELSDYGNIQDKSGEKKYKSCYSNDFGVGLAEMPAPEEYENILDFVNRDMRWNGRLEHIFEIFQGVGNVFSDELAAQEVSAEQWKEGNSNLSYVFVDIKAQKIYTNQAAYGKFEQLDNTIAELKSSGKYVILQSKLSECETNISDTDLQEWKHTVKSYNITDGAFIYIAQIDTEYPIQDLYYHNNQQYEKYAKYAPYVSGMQGPIAALLLFMLAVVWLTIVAGRRSTDEEIHLHWLDRIKTEVMAGVSIFAICLLASGLLYVVGGGNNTYQVAAAVIISLIVLVLCAICFIAYLSLIRRIKAKTLWKDSILRIFWGFTKMTLGNIETLWKVLLMFGGFIFLHWIVMSDGGTQPGVFLMFASEIAVVVYLIKRAIGQKTIVVGLERITAGEVDYQIPVKGLRGEQFFMAQRINVIGEGLEAAVEASVKNERLKTDLITNVSHDIKTPLTSIINYVDLLKRENFTDPKINGYLDILEAKAQRLRTLTEDVVEASKVSSGNINLEYINMNLVEMIQQTSGEFEEKFTKRNLTEVLTLPEESAIIRADGKRVWRVLENIYNNAAKYAMKGTRIYADLKSTQQEVIFTLKNVSEYPLNISADELTERFIRGDISRGTEGSGLGLSIAKNLTEMQGGQFEIYVEGDLFRVTIVFPRSIKSEQLFTP